MFSVIKLLSERRVDRPDHPALVDKQDVCSFKDLHNRTHQSSLALNSFGVKEGDRIGICMGKSIDQAVVILAPAVVPAFVDFACIL